MSNEMQQNEVVSEDEGILEERNKFMLAIKLVRRNDDQTYEFDDVIHAILPEQPRPIDDSNLTPDDLHKLDRFGCFMTCQGKLFEAAAFFERILVFEPCFLKSMQNLDNVKHRLIERWHFGMLNDSERNAKFKSAIKKAIQNRGQVSVLDIGTGTGLLALYAAECGAESVYACEQSQVMCKLSKKAFQLNGCDDRIKLIPKHSTDIDVENDLNGKVDLIVTETMDCGVFGEGLLQTLIHAKENLLKNSGQIIPSRAKVYIAGYQCRALASEKNVVNSSTFTDTIYVRNYTLCSNDDEPYDSCYVQHLSDFKLVTRIEQALDVNLNNLDELYALFNGQMKKTLQLAYIADDEISILDGFCLWFSMSLDSDDTITIDTNPFEQSSGDQQSCWECAIFRINHRFDNTQKLQNLNLTVSCKDGALHLEHFYNFIGKNFSNISSDIIKYLNDTEFIDRIEFDVFAEINKTLLTKEKKSINSVLDFLPFPSIGIALLKEGRLGKLYCSQDAQELVQFIANANCISLTSIIFIEDPSDVMFIDEKFDIILLPMIEKFGTLTAAHVTNYPILKANKLRPRGFMVPERVEVLFELVNSKWLRNVTRVTDPEIVDRLQIGSLINKYATTVQMDLAEEFPHRCVYSEYQAAELKLNDSFVQLEHQLYVGELNESNIIHGIHFHFNILFTKNSKGMISTKRSNSFANTSCFICNDNYSKRDNGFVVLRYRQNNGVIHMTIK